MKKNSLGSVQSAAGWGILACAALAVALTAPARGQRVIDPVTNAITDSQPVMEAAKLLERRYGTPVTYEDPVWPRKVRRDLLDTDPGEMAAFKALRHSFVMPKGLTPAENPRLTAALLGSVVDAYHSQNPRRPHFRVIESKLGLHIAPVSVPDATGALVPAVSLLDARITVPSVSRTAAEHVNAICAAAASAVGVRFIYREHPNDLELFDHAFAANGYAVPGGGGIYSAGEIRPTFEEARPRMVFTWGTQETTARDALLDLMDRSATTMGWGLICPMAGGAPGTAADFPCNIWLQPVASASGAAIMFDRKTPTTLR